MPAIHHHASLRSERQTRNLPPKVYMNSPPHAKHIFRAQDAPTADSATLRGLHTPRLSSLMSQTDQSILLEAQIFS